MLSDGDHGLPCPKCEAPMVNRVAKRGKNPGNEFWSFSTFPKCRSIVPIGDSAEDNSVEATIGGYVCQFSSSPPDPPKGLLRKAFAAVDGVWRWNIELDEPDTTDRRNREHCRNVINYVDVRDGDSARCAAAG